MQLFLVLVHLLQMGQKFSCNFVKTCEKHLNSLKNQTTAKIILSLSLSLSLSLRHTHTRKEEETLTTTTT